MRYVLAQEDVTIPLGRQGENNAETVRFDVHGWAEEYGEGSFELLHERCMDTAPYACPITVDDEIVSWVVRGADTAYVGRGVLELIYSVGDNAVAKSVMYHTSTLKAIDGDAEFPDPYDDWLRQMHEDAEYVREHYEGAIEAHYDAEAWAVGTRGGEPVDEDDPAYENSSKYHAQQSEASAQESAASAESAEESETRARMYYGAPLVASTAAGMTDQTRVYVYTGSESGYVSGNWYYWNGTAWTSGGVYNSNGEDTASDADIDALLYS